LERALAAEMTDHLGIVSAGEERSHYGRFRPEPVVHPGEPPVDGDAVRTLHSF
jgi:hypothetical protein